MRRKPKYHFKKSVIFLLALIVLVGGFFRGIRISMDAEKAQAVATTQSKAEQLQQQVSDLEQAEYELRTKIFALESKAPKMTEEKVRELVKALFPEKAQNRFLAILKCENGTHDPYRINWNKPGLGYDLGLAQINSRWHKERVEKIFGQPFDEAMSDPEKNLIYASLLYKQQGNFDAWVCNRII